MVELLLSICLSYQMINTLEDFSHRSVLSYDSEVKFVVFIYRMKYRVNVLNTHLYGLRTYIFRVLGSFFSDVALFQTTVYYRL